MFRELNPLLHSELRLRLHPPADRRHGRQPLRAAGQAVPGGLHHRGKDLPGQDALHGLPHHRCGARRLCGVCRGAAKLHPAEVRPPRARHAQAQPANTRGGAARIARGTEGSRKPCSEPKEAARIAYGTEGPQRRTRSGRSRTDRPEGAARGLKGPETHGRAPREVRSTEKFGPGCITRYIPARTVAREAPERELRTTAVRRIPPPA